MHMKHIPYLLIACLFLLMGSSCENDGFLYQDESRIRMEGPEEWTLETDSLEFSFVSYHRAHHERDSLRHGAHHRL